MWRPIRVVSTLSFNLIRSLWRRPGGAFTLIFSSGDLNITNFNMYFDETTPMSICQIPMNNIERNVLNFKTFVLV